MDNKIDSYTTVARPSEEIVFKDKNSKFFGQVFPIASEDEVKSIISGLRKKHSAANHVCYAWQLGVDQINYRANDDGEPNNSAGMPIYGQIKASGLTNVLIIVAREFGGTKLGVGGLINAYRTAAKMALDSSKIVSKRLKVSFELRFPYSEMDGVMRTVKKNQLKIESQHMEMDCQMTISIPKSKGWEVSKMFGPLKHVSIKKLNG